MTAFLIEISEELINALARRLNNEQLSPAELLHLLALQVANQDGIGLESAYRWMRVGEETEDGDEVKVNDIWMPAPLKRRVSFAYTHRRRVL